MRIQTSRVLRALVCAFVFLSLFLQPTLGTAAAHSIAVQIICKLGVGVADVRVQLVPKGTGSQPGYDFRSDSNGRVSFRNLSPGTYDIVVTCGTSTFTHTIFTGAGMANFAHSYVFRCCPTPPGSPPDPDNGLISIDDKTVTPDVTANSKAVSRAVAANTNDWQPGDEVSFSFTGTVYGPAAEKQTQDDYTGSIVGIVDSQGNKTEVPWSKLIKYTVPIAATSVIATLMKPDRTIIASTNIPVHPNGTPLPIQLPRKVTGYSVAHPVCQIGEPYKIYSPNNELSGDANKIKLRTRNKLDNTITVSNAVAASPRTAMFGPQAKAPGFFEFTVTDEGRFEESFDVSAVGIKLDTSRAYRVNQKGTLEVIVALPPQAYAQQELLAANFKTTIEMETPAILNFTNGQNPVVWQLQKSEIDKNQARKEFSVKSGTTGTFRATARAQTPQCSNPTITTNKSGERVVISGPPVFYKPGDQEKDPCAEIRGELEKLKTNLKKAEQDAKDLIKSEAPKRKGLINGNDTPKEASEKCKTELAKLEKTKAAMVRSVGANHPRTTELQAKIDELKSFCDKLDTAPLKKGVEQKEKELDDCEKRKTETKPVEPPKPTDGIPGDTVPGGGKPGITQPGETTKAPPCKEGETRGPTTRVVSCEISDVVATRLGYSPDAAGIFKIGVAVLKRALGSTVGLGELMASAFSGNAARHIYIKIKIKYVDETWICKDGVWVLESSKESETETGWIKLFDKNGGGIDYWTVGSTGKDAEAAVNDALAANGCP